MVNHHSFAGLLSNIVFDVEVRLQMQILQQKEDTQIFSLLQCGFLEAKLALLQTREGVRGSQIMTVATQGANRTLVGIGWRVTRLWRQQMKEQGMGRSYIMFPCQEKGLRKQQAQLGEVQVTDQG